MLRQRVPFRGARAPTGHGDPMLTLLISQSWAADVLRSHELLIVDVRGIAAADGELLALDPKRAEIRRWHTGGGDWRPARAVALPAGIEAPRGLALTDGAAWLLDWAEGSSSSTIWRIELASGEGTSAPLSRVIGDAQPFDLAWHDTQLYLATSAGLLRLDVGAADPGAVPTASHLRLPDNGPPTRDGLTPTQSVTIGEVDGVPYLITSARAAVIVSDLRTGRGLFFVDRPTGDFPIWGLATDGDQLWVPDRIERARDTLSALSLSTLDATDPGPWWLRTAHLSTRSVPRDSAPDTPGWVTHAYGHPLQLPTQQPLMDRWRATADGDPIETQPTWEVGDDPDTIQTDTIFRWDRGAQIRKSEVELWVMSRNVRQGVYPHRITAATPPAPGYVADSWLHRLDHRRRWRRFHDRIVDYVSERYHLSEAEARAELDHPYWAARDTVDYIFSAYLYPSRELDIDVTVDRSRGIFHGYPADEKAALSARPFTGHEVLACNGANLVLEGALRSLGLGTRLMGAIFARPEEGWDLDGDGFLDPGEQHTGVKGHQYAQVWLGEPYGWQVFDATPESFVDAERNPPPLPAQWDVMKESVATQAGRRVVMSLFSGPHDPMVRNYPTKAEGFEQAYAFFGRYQLPQHWRYPEHRLQFHNPLSLEVTTSPGEGGTTDVRWRTVGPWELLPDPQLEILAEPWSNGARSGAAQPVLEAIAASASEASLVLPEPPEDARWRIVVRLVGDKATGARTDPLDPNDQDAPYTP